MSPPRLHRLLGPALAMACAAVLTTFVASSWRTPPTSLALASAGGADRNDQRSASIDLALARATEYLMASQHADGMWRSTTYGAMRDGLVLTPAIAKALSFAAQHDARACASFDATVRALVAAAPRDGAAQPTPYPVSTAALAAIALQRAGAILDQDRFPHRELQAAHLAWVDELRRHQLGTALGWAPGDPDFGGWGYSVEPPRRPSSGLVDELPFGSDLSSTLLAVGALRLGGASVDSACLRHACAFAMRCQNWSDDLDPAFDDGGFATTPHQAAQNKAGEAGIGAGHAVRFNSYGSATADGLRILLRCGTPLDHPRVQSAIRWLDVHFDAVTNPGRFSPQREAERDAARFYWAWSIAHAWRDLDAAGDRSGGVRRRQQAAQLVDAILAEQRLDGSWCNPNPFMKEDDPLIATILAMGALGAARDLVLGAP